MHQPVGNNKDTNPLRNQLVAYNEDTSPLRNQPFIDNEDTSPQWALTHPSITQQPWFQLIKFLKKWTFSWIFSTIKYNW